MKALIRARGSSTCFSLSSSSCHYSSLFIRCQVLLVHQVTQTNQVNKVILVNRVRIRLIRGVNCITSFFLSFIIMYVKIRLNLNYYLLYSQYCIYNIVFATSFHLMKTKAVAAPEEKMENIVTRYFDIQLFCLLKD